METSMEMEKVGLLT